MHIHVHAFWYVSMHASILTIYALEVLSYFYICRIKIIIKLIIIITSGDLIYGRLLLADSWETVFYRLDSSNRRNEHEDAPVPMKLYTSCKDHSSMSKEIYKYRLRCWNVRTMSGKEEELIDEMMGLRFYIGVSEAMKGNEV